MQPVVEIVVTDALDTSAVDRNHSVIEHAMATGPAHLIVDLTRCSTVDQAGVALLADVHRTVSGNGGQLTLRGLSMPLCVLLQSARLDDILHDADRPSGYWPRHRRRRRRARQIASERQCDELRWWLAPATERAG